MKQIFIILIFLPIFASGQRSYIQYWSTKYTRNTEGDIVILPDGKILSYFTRFYGGSADNSGSEVYCKISLNGGLMWYNYNLAQANMGTQNTMSVSTMYESGTIWLFFCVKNSNTDLRVFYKKSTDQGITWTAPQQITTGGGYQFIANNRVQRLASGRLVVPVTYCMNVGNVGTSERLRARLYYSDDNGANWSFTPDIDVPAFSRGWAEHGIVELSAGNLLMYGRVQTGFRQYFAVSTNNGTTWGTPYQSTLISPEAPAKIIKLSDGRLLAAHCNNAVNQTRRPLVLSASSDNGATWTQKYVLANNTVSWFTYPSVLEVEGTVYVSYWEQIMPKNVFSLAFQKIPISELL